MTSLFHAVAAVAKTSEQAQQMALPFLMLFILFNGYFVTLSSCQPWMKWAIYISPMFYAIQQIAVALYNNPEDEIVIVTYQFHTEYTPYAIAVLCGEMAIFRCIQAFALKALNSVQR
mmetsp:Transcript_11387/g.26307  ORF Transcript_11387/g.26307 Transcript_11387/m.26307 type:complete len:117 (-) Transcript_11387:242-592(-)